MNHLSTLESLGLTKDEALAYLGLLKLGQAKAADLAQEVGVKRTTIYPILVSLKQKGFAAEFIHKTKRLYRAENPERVAGLLEKRLESFVTAIPELKTLEKVAGATIGLRFIETKQELKQFYLGVLTDYKDKSYRVIGSSTAWVGIEPDFFNQFRFDRAHNHIKTRILLSADSTAESPEDPTLLREVRILPPTHTFKSTMDIFDDKVIIISPELTALAVVIAIPAMVDIFKSMFDLLWESTKG